MSKSFRHGARTLVAVALGFFLYSSVRGQAVPEFEHADIDFQLQLADGSPAKNCEFQVLVVTETGQARFPQSENSKNEEATTRTFNRIQLFYGVEFDGGSEPRLAEHDVVAVFAYCPDADETGLWVHRRGQGMVPRAESIVLTMQPASVCRGSVIDAATLEAIPNARVHLMCKSIPDLAWSFPRFADVTTDEDGAFMIPGIPAGATGTIMATHENYLRPDDLGPAQELAGNVLSVKLVANMEQATETGISPPSLAGLERPEAYSLLESSYAEAYQTLENQMADATDPAERQLVMRHYSPTVPWTQAMLELAKAQPSDETAFRALLWINRLVPKYSDSLASHLELKSAAAALVLAHHASRHEIVDALDWIVARSVDPLQAVDSILAANSSRDVQGNALRIKAKILATQLSADDRMMDRALLTGQTTIEGNRMVGDQQIPFKQTLLTNDDRIALLDELRAVSRQMIGEFADVRAGAPDGEGPLLEQIARQQLFELDHLVIGSTAPVIETVDLTREPMSSAAGEFDVTVVYFWASWCGPCKKFLPELNELHDQRGLNVRVIGIMADSADVARQTIEALDIRFPNAAEAEDGPIHSQWNIDSWPSVFILDRNGKVRFHRFASTVGAKEIRRRVDWVLDHSDVP